MTRKKIFLPNLAQFLQNIEGKVIILFVYIIKVCFVLLSYKFSLLPFKKLKVLF